MTNNWLTPLQAAFLNGFFAAEASQRFFLTGGTSLAAFHLHHRHSVDLDLFTLDDLALSETDILIPKLATELGCRIGRARRTEHFRQFLLEPAHDQTLQIDLVRDFGPQYGTAKRFGIAAFLHGRGVARGAQTVSPAGYYASVGPGRSAIFHCCVGRPFARSDSSARGFGLRTVGLTQRGCLTNEPRERLAICQRKRVAQPMARAMTNAAAAAATPPISMVWMALRIGLAPVKAPSRSAAPTESPSEELHPSLGSNPCYWSLAHAVQVC